MEEKQPDKASRNSKKESLYKRFINLNHDHPVLMNILYIILASIVLIWFLLLFIDSWTRHGDEAIVPMVKGQSIELATRTLAEDGFSCEVMDSVFGSTQTPGTVVEQTPREGSHVKPGRTIYVSIVAYSPKMVTIPDFLNVSMRQGVSMFEGIGLKVTVVTVPSEYKNLVLGAKINGHQIRAGERVPSSSSVILEVGGGLADEDEEDTEDFTEEYSAE